MSEAARCFGVAVDDLRQMRKRAPRAFSNEDIYNGGRARMVRELLEKNVSLSTRQLARKMHTTLEAAERQLYRMQEAGEVVNEPQGERGAMRWRLS